MNETVTPPPTVSSHLLTGCRSRLSFCSLAVIGLYQWGAAWIHFELGEGLDAEMLSNIWHVPPPTANQNPPSFKQQRAGDLTRGLHQDAPLCAGSV